MRASRGFTLIQADGGDGHHQRTDRPGGAQRNASTSRELDSEPSGLAGLIGVLTDEAVLDNREYGLRLGAMPTRYCATTKRRRAGCRWRATATACGVGGRPSSWTAAAGAGRQQGRKEEEGTDQPQLLILSSGELSPFRLRLAERGPRGGRCR